jgi:hypothetical protein
LSARIAGFIMEIDGVVDYDSEAERTGTPSLVGQRLPPPKKRRRRKRYYSGTSQRK